MVDAGDGPDDVGEVSGGAATRRFENVDDPEAGPCAQYGARRMKMAGMVRSRIMVSSPRLRVAM